MIIVCISSRVLNPLQVSLPMCLKCEQAFFYSEPAISLPVIVPKMANKCSFCVFFRQQAVKKSLSWMGMERGTKNMENSKKTDNCRGVGRGTILFGSKSKPV